MKTYASAIKKIAANDPLIIIGLTFVINKKREIGIPPKVPNPFIVPETIPAEILVGRLLIRLFEYPLSCNITKNIMIKQIDRWAIFGDKNFKR